MRKTILLSLNFCNGKIENKKYFWFVKGGFYIRKFIGADDNLIATTTVITMDTLNSGDEIFVEMILGEDHGDSHIFSSVNEPAIHFVGHKIAD